MSARATTGRIAWARAGLCLLGLLCVGPIAAEERPAMKPWFQHEVCEAVELQKPRGIEDPSVVARRLIEDPAVAQRLMKLISALPADGPKMKSFAASVPVLNLVFHCGKETETVSFYGGRIKTPSTGFYAGSVPEEERLSKGIEALFRAAYSSPVWLVRGHEQVFPDFRLVYTGERAVSGAPATVSFTTREFTIFDGNKPPQKLSVSHGQRAPDPLTFQVGGRAYTLYTFRGPKGEDLFPDHYLIAPK